MVMSTQTYQPGMWIFTSLSFWEGVAEIYDTYGVPRDLISLRLREEGVQFSDEEFNTLLDYMVRRRNRIGETQDVSKILIRLPESWVGQAFVNSLIH